MTMFEVAILLTYRALSAWASQKGIIAVRSFLLMGDVRSMNLVSASLNVIESPVGNGVF